MSRESHIDEGKLYRNVRSGAIVKVLKHDAKSASIATLKDGVIGRSRTVQVGLIHPDTLDSANCPHTSGYVPLVTAESQPVADTGSTSTSWSDMDLMDNLEALSLDELTELAAKHEKIKKEAADIVEKVKNEIKARRDPGFTIMLQGAYALEFKPGEKFDAKAALRNLEPADFARILLPKPDATQARRVFEFEPEKLSACMVDPGPSLTIREATAKDRVKHNEQVGLNLQKAMAESVDDDSAVEEYVL